MKPLFFILFCAVFSSSLYAQQPQRPPTPPNTPPAAGNAARPGGYPGAFPSGPSITGRISGRLLDSLSKSPIEFATVVLQDAASKKQIDGLTTDEKGGFKFPEVKLGKYQLTISFIGYRNKTVTGINLSPEKPDYDAGELGLASESVSLQTVEVTGQAALIENKIDKLVYNAEKDIATSAGDASDVLQRVPLLAIDGDGNVSLRGSSNVQILINGKPSAIFSGNVADALKSIPADQIKSVEVITSPSAKYDGEGSAGIINIITRKKAPQGFTGSVSASGGTRSNNANLSLNYAKGRFGLNFNGGSFYTPPRPSGSEFLREDYASTGTRILDQVSTGRSSFYGPRGTLAMTYDLNAYNNFSSSLTVNGFGRTADNETNASFIDPSINLNQLYDRTTDASSLRGGFDWVTDYRRTFKKPEQELAFAVQLSGQNSLTKNSIFQEGNEASLYRNENNENDGLNLELTFQTDYVHPLSKKIKLETGAKAVLRDINSDFIYRTFDQATNQFIVDQLRSDVFNYDQDVWAVYASFNIKLGQKWGLLAGARYEATDIAGDYEDPEVAPFGFDYDNFLPSITLNRTLSQTSSIKVSYAKRIQRPSLNFINPYVELNDPRDITVGNPLLLPEENNLMELTYNAFIKGWVVNAGLFWRNTQAIIEPVLNVIDDGVSLTSFQNVGQADTYGFNLFTSVTTLKEKLQLRGGATISYYAGEGVFNNVRLSNTGYFWNGNVSATFSITKDLKFEANGFYLSPRVGIQGTRSAYTRSSFAIRKDLWKKKGSLGIIAVQPFRRDIRFPSNLEGPTFRQDSEFYFAQRSYGFTFSYRFGKLDFKQRTGKGSKIKNDDLKDGGDNNF